MGGQGGEDTLHIIPSTTAIAAPATPPARHGTPKAAQVAVVLGGKADSSMEPGFQKRQGHPYLGHYSLQLEVGWRSPSQEEDPIGSSTPMGGSDRKGCEPLGKCI